MAVAVVGEHVEGLETVDKVDGLAPEKEQNHQNIEISDESHHLRHEPSVEEDVADKKPNEEQVQTEKKAAEIALQKKPFEEKEEQQQQQPPPPDNQQQQVDGKQAAKDPNEKIPHTVELPLAEDKHEDHEHDKHEDEEIGQSVAKGEGEEDEVENPEDYYFYAFDENSVVIEDLRYEGTADLAPFIWDPQPGEIRIVEFYAHWCPHCQKLRPKFNKFAKRMLEIAEQSGLNLKVYAVSCVPHRYICKKNDVHNYPRVKLFLDGSKEGIEIPHNNVHPFEVLKRIGAESMAKGAEGLAITDGAWEEEEKDGEDTTQDSVAPLVAPDGSFWIPRTKKEIYNDAYLSFDFAMRNAIFAQKDPLTEEAKEAFFDFVYVLAEVLPPTWQLQWMVAEILEHADTVLDSEENLFKILDKYPPKKKKWSKACTRGKGAMGYTCGLWQLFHIMTVGMVEWNINNVAGKKKSFYSTNETAETLRLFIEHFFGCEVCRINFIQEYDSCSFNRCERLSDKPGKLNDWKELPLWLFEFHNGVNVRLLKERAEAEKRTPTSKELKDVEWPTRSHCPSCWFGDGRFDPERVYMFLHLIYWPDELISSSKMAELVAFTTHGHAGQEERMFSDPVMEDGIESWVYSLVGLILASIVLSAASWVKKKHDIKRTGKHKKVDGDGNNC
ncbi:Erv1 / Alr family protein [Nitzschia inconspicua]|uniref:Erv1 / Alr family protein n=1 Tax=Nitzschia inconspicua TaxID=303405 RepID=A0A9K3L5I9_9STRA|nr:Erv1 / Alr family protein [Nitzschia inconspicua]